MQEFQRGYITLKPEDDQIAEYMEQHGLNHAAGKKFYDEMLNDEIWINDTYQVAIHYDTDAHWYGSDVDITHLSIKRRDKEVIHDWRDLQEIKNLLVGPEREAMELYPAETRRVDTANQYHLWVIPAANEIPIGWRIRLVTDSADAAAIGATQRPLEAV